LPGQLAVAAGALVLLASGFVVAAAQAQRSVVIYQLLESTRTAEGYLKDEGIANLGIHVQFVGLVFLGALLLLTLTVVALGLTLSWRADAIGRHRSLNAVALLLPAWPPAAGLLLYGLRLHKGFWGTPGVDAATKTADILRSIDGAYPIIEAARVGMLLLVAVGAITAVVAWRRAPLRPVSSVRLAAAVLVFVAGLSAFIATRGHAADRHPLPILSHAMDTSYASKVPSISPCPPAESAPALEFNNDVVRFNGRPADPDDFRTRFVVDRNDYALLHAGRQLLFLVIEADRATPIDRIIPYLQKALEGTTVLIASAASRPILSKTLGTVARYEYCGRTFRLGYEQTATPLSRYRSWSDVAAAVSRDAEIVEMAPW
jgi:hypothetical protein